MSQDDLKPPQQLVVSDTKLPTTLHNVDVRGHSTSADSLLLGDSHEGLVKTGAFLKTKRWLTDGRALEILCCLVPAASVAAVALILFVYNGRR